MNTFGVEEPEGYLVIPFVLREEETKLDRKFSKLPFVPAQVSEKEKRICRFV